MPQNEQTEIKKEYYHNGNMQSETPYLNGEKHGIEREFYRNGALRRETPFDHNRKNGVEKFFYENGNIKVEIPYTKNRRDGIEKHYYEYGVLRAELPHSKGLQHGTCKWYKKDGTLQREEIFNNGLSADVKYDEKYLEGLVLIEAIWHHEFEKAREMVENGADVNAPYQENGWTPFMKICREFGQGPEFKWYVEHGGDVNYANKSGETALHILAQRNNYTNLFELKNFGCNFNAQDRGGYTPLMLAVSRQALHWGGSVPEEFFTLTDTTIKNKHGQTVFNIIKSEWSRDPKYYFELMSNDTKNYELARNLKKAIEENDAEKVKHLLEQGAKADFPLDYNGMTPFLFACRKCDNLHILQMLADAVTDINIPMEDKQTPVSLAVKYQKSAALLELLIKNDAYADWKDNKGNTPLMTLLLDQKVSNRLDEYRVLLPNTDLTVINAKGQTVIDYAKSNPDFNDKNLLTELQKMYEEQLEAKKEEVEFSEEDIAEVWVDGCVPGQY